MFDVAQLTEALDKLEESFDADPFLFCDSKTSIAREHLLARFEDLLSRARASMANQGERLVVPRVSSSVYSGSMRKGR